MKQKYRYTSIYECTVEFQLLLTYLDKFFSFSCLKVSLNKDTLKSVRINFAFEPHSNFVRKIEKSTLKLEIYTP